nr:ABC transporter substrate-binding protein [Marinicella sp. W31]MDC2875442.1 ABC transporter substrate-binding protein [Marinicella sp. W31]
MNLSRRHFLAAGTALAGSLALPAWAQNATASNGADLPPLSGRLPENPLVLTPRDRAGKQGGTWNHALVGGGSLSMLFRYQSYEPTVRFTPDWSGVTPNVAEKFEVNDDSTVYTFTLRKGMKWSDGHPYTTEDVQFWYEDIFSSTDLTTTGQTFWFAGGKPAELEVVDAQVFKVKFAEPNGFLPSSSPGPIRTRSRARRNIISNSSTSNIIRMRTSSPRIVAMIAGSHYSSVNAACRKTMFTFRTPNVRR